MTDTLTLSSCLTPLPVNLPCTQLLSNYYEPTFALEQCFHVYTTTFQPNVLSDNRRMRGLLFQSAESQLTKIVGAHVLSGINLFAVNEVQTDIELCANIDSEKYDFHLRYSHKVAISDISVHPEVAIILNIILKRALKFLGLKQITRLPHYYDELRTARIPELGLEIWPGYITHLTLLSCGPLVNIDYIAKVVHTRNLLEVLCEYREKGGEWMEQAKAHLENRIVMARYGNRRCYRIDEIVFNKSPMSRMAREAELTYIEYYKTRYQETITIPNQPLIQSKARFHGQESSIYLVPELLTLTGLDAELRADFRAMSRIAVTTNLDPQERLRESTALSEKINGNEEASGVLKSFGIRICQKPKVTKVHDLSGESVYTSGRTVHPIDETGRFQLREGILTSIPLTNWLILTPNLDSAKSFISALYTRLLELDPQTREPETISYLHAKDLKAKLQIGLDRQNAQFLVILLTKRIKDLYAEVKRLATTEYAVPSQVVVVPISVRHFRAVTDKIALQIQAKVGAQLWTVRPFLTFGKFLMVVGIDIFHDLVNRKKSVLGFCATIHPNLSKYYSTTSVQDSGMEIATAIGQLFLEAVHVFSEKAKRPPESVVFFRDGVSETQINSVKQFEVDSILRSCKLVAADYSPDILYTVVIKKTNAKFFSRHSSAVCNPRPGTLIASDIVPASGDFYLIAHFASQGSSVPVLYKTLYASHPERFPLEDLARLAYKLCHMYYNWEGAVKVPAPCIMAHKIAYFVGQCLHSPVTHSMRTLAFYL